MNLLTFDIEEWVLEKERFGNRKERFAELDKNLDHILELLEETNQSATFFCLGKMALSFPHVVRKIQASGHEIGSHSYAHKWVNKMTADEFREDTISAIKGLEDVTGSEVVSFRAPAFSIGESNKWAIEILADCGIQNDASIFPGVRDFGGFPSFSCQYPCKIEYNGAALNEFPIPLYRLPVIGLDLAYSGGGYFRLLPLGFVKTRIKCNDYNMCYFHIGDLLTEGGRLMTKAEYEDYFKEPGTLKSRYLRYFKSNIGRKRAMRNLELLMKGFEFISISEWIKENTVSDVVRI